MMTVPGFVDGFPFWKSTGFKTQASPKEESSKPNQPDPPGSYMPAQQTTEGAVAIAPAGRNATVHVVWAAQ